MKKIIYAGLVLGLLVPCHAALARTLSKHAVVDFAEKFVVENGYTSAMPNGIKRQLDLESIERTNDRSETLRRRYNTLQPEAIGAKQGRRGAKAGWSIAFDYVPDTSEGRDICRVVTMDDDGSNIRIEHIDGIRKFFAVFD